jgi:hypothetical protein
MRASTFVLGDMRYGRDGSLFTIVPGERNSAAADEEGQVSFHWE